MHALFAEARDFLTEEDLPEKVVTKMPDVTKRHEIESTGRWVIALSGRMIPGEIYVNGELIFSFYTDEGDATVLLYLMKGDSVQVVGAEHSIRKVEYA